jgi:hypothetical protein
MLIHKHIKDITVTSGSGSDNTLKFSGGELVQIYAEAVTSTNIFDLALIDEDGDEIYGEDAIEGSFEEHGIYVPFRGIYTITITSATVDENIRVKLLVEE